MLMHCRQTSSSSRARRFPLGLPVVYQAPGDSEWYGGVTESISSSGLVIRADEPVVPAESVTVVISLPSTPAEPGACLVGHGYVARTIASQESALAAFAVDIAEFRFHRRDALPKSAVAAGPPNGATPAGHQRVIGRRSPTD